MRKYDVCVLWNGSEQHFTWSAENYGQAENKAMELAQKHQGLNVLSIMELE